VATGYPVIVLRSLLVCLLLLPAAARAAQPEQGSNQQLDEIIVNGVRVKPDRDAVKILGWLRRFVGDFSYSGYVDVRAEGIPRQSQRQGVAGSARCVAFGKAPGVNCSLSVIWSEVHAPDGGDVLGGVSTLNPAMLQLGLDPDRLGIRFMQVDNRGIADRGNGYLFTNTLTTTNPCAGIPDCLRTTRINAHPDGNFIEMQIDLEKDGIRVVRYLLVMTRKQPDAGAAAAEIR
jgi:hypothetical protein